MAWRALVTGASGFVGGYAARRLAGEEGMAVRALVRRPGGPTKLDLNRPGIELVQGDLRDPAALVRAAEGVDVVVHAAADMRLRSEAESRAVTVEGTRQVLLAAQRAGARVFVHVSTIAVYGGSQRADEEAALRPYGDRYGDAKIAAERALREAASGTPWVAILRPPMVYGPHSQLWTATLARLVARGWPACLDGGRALFPYTYIENLVDAISAAARAGLVGPRPDGPVRAYNIVDGITTWATYLGYFGRAFGRPVHSLPSRPLAGLAWLSEKLAGAFGRRALLNRASLRLLTLRELPGYTAERAERELGWRPRIGLDEGMARSLAWLEKHVAGLSWHRAT